MSRETNRSCSFVTAPVAGVLQKLLNAPSLGVGGMSSTIMRAWKIGGSKTFRWRPAANLGSSGFATQNSPDLRSSFGTLMPLFIRHKSELPLLAYRNACSAYVRLPNMLFYLQIVAYPWKPRTALLGGMGAPLDDEWRFAFSFIRGAQA